MKFSVRCTPRPPTVHVRVRGDLDIFTAKQVGRSVERAVVDDGCRRVVLDAGEVTFVNGSALGVLMRTLTTVTAAAGTMEFSAASAPLERLCALTGVGTILGLPGTRGAAALDSAATPA